ncbi:MAG: hypothetical protein ING19_20705 [Azospirillum sp.]|nr:hypothetical protein [Azospirillum sp.]MCA3268472.1 hypothetical protein [Azospirillum sp.]
MSKSRPTARRKSASHATARRSTPKRVEVVYRTIDSLHVFEAPDFLGLHSADANLKSAFAGIGDAVTAYMQAVARAPLVYRPEISFAQFRERLKSGSYTTGRRFHAELQETAAQAAA